MCSGPASRLWQKARAWCSSIDVALLQSGLLTLKWTSYFVDDDVGVTSLIAGECKYTHVSQFLRNPFRMIVVVMEECGRGVGESVYLRAALQDGYPILRTLQAFLLEQDFACALEVEPLLLSERQTPMAHLNGQVAIVEANVAKRILWEGTRDLNQAPRRRRQRPADDRLARGEGAGGGAEPQGAQDSGGESGQEQEEEEEEEEEEEDLLNILLRSLHSQQQAGAGLDNRGDLPAATSSSSSSSSASSSSSTSSSSSSSSSDSNSEPGAPADEPAAMEVVAESPRERRVGVNAGDRQQHDKLQVLFNNRPCGYLKINPSLQNMFATCMAHPDCVKSQTLHHSARRSGRPIGYLAAWLQASSSCASKAEHMRHVPPRDKRRSARASAKQEWNSEPFFQAEADPDGSASEPA